MSGQWSLPAGWEWVPLENICEIFGGGTPRRSNGSFFGGGIVWITPSDLNQDLLIQSVTESETTLSEVGVNSSSARLLPPGTVLFSSRATVGKIAIAGTPLTTNQGFINFVCSEGVYNKFLAYSLRLLTSQIKGLATSTTYLEVSKHSIRPFRVPIPHPLDLERSLAEQQRIVARIEALLNEVQEISLLQEILADDCNKLMDALLAESFAPEELPKWPNKTILGELAEITARQVDPTLPDYRDMPHIFGGTIEEGTGKLLEFNTVAEDGMTSNKYYFNAGAVLYSKIRPYLRKVTIVDFNGLCSADMYPLRLKTDDLLPEFLMWSLLSPAFTNYANNLSARARIPKLNRTQLFSYEFPYPEKMIQREICQRLNYAREEIREMSKLNEADLEYLNQLEQAILAQAFRGEL